MREEERIKLEEQRKIFDAITKEWLDEKYAQFGRWTFKSIMAVAFVAVLKAVFHASSSDLQSVIDAASAAHDLAR